MTSILRRFSHCLLLVTSGEYLFYVDLTFDNFTRYRQAIDAITPLVKSIKILGEYKEN